MASAENTKTTAVSSAVTDQKSEVASIKSAFPNRCRIISDVGEYSNIVTVQPENMDVTITFQLTSAYPTVIPEIAIRSESLNEAAITDIREILRAKAKEMIGQPMICALIVEAECQLKASGLKPGKTLKVNGHTYLDKKPKKSKQPKRKPKSKDEIVDDKKLPSMKTADDVVKRIIWDDALEKDDFIVGYIDRFRGLVEKYFSAFSWEDLASVDYDVLAIPKHRIQYFKYKDVKVWDKVRRIDNVFGSAEGTKTIDVVIKEVQEMERLSNLGASDAVKTSSTQYDNNDEDEYDDEDDDSSDDDGIVVTIGSSANIGVSLLHKARESQKKSEADCDQTDENKPNAFMNHYWRNKLRPNYFLCVRITNEEIIKQIGNIQDHLMEKEPLLAECCIPGVSLHCTLTTVGLETSEQLWKCVEALKKMKPDLENALPKSVLKLQGVSHFFDRVIYAKVVFEEDFLEFVNILKMLLQEAGVSIRDGYEFVPHVTIMKVTRPVSRLRGTKDIDPVWYTEFAGTYFGEQKVDSVYLCSMGNERRDDGFYLTPLEMHF